MKPRITWKAAVLPVIGILAFLIYLYLFDVDVVKIIETARYVDACMHANAHLNLLASILPRISCSAMG